MKRIVVLLVLASLSLGANALVQTCYYGKYCINGEEIRTCDVKCYAMIAAKKSRQEQLNAQKRDLELKAKREAELAAQKAQQEKDATALAAIGKVQKNEDEISVVLSNEILFQYGKTNLSKGAKKTLNQAVAILNQSPNRSLVIQGHTDSISSEAYNMKLSEQRAKNVYDYMMQQGLNIKSVSYKGYGETKPIADNSTEEGRNANRRVEFKIK